MPVSLVLTLIGPDRPGLVEALSRTLAAHQANWLESRMARLADRYAGILIASVPEAHASALREALERLAEAGLRVHVEVGLGAADLGEHRAVRLELTGQDRPGIVHEIAEALAALGVGIDELETRILSASWSGERLFECEAVLRVPASVRAGALREVLERLANELMVDLTVDEVTS